MSDLISRSALIKVLKDRATNEAIMGYMTAYDVTNSIIDEVMEQPTTYSVDKVVKELKELKMRYFLTIANTGDEKSDFAYENVGNALDKAIEIVKQGGVSDDVCEWKSASDGEFIKNPHTKRLFSNEPSMKNVYCNTCGKKIKVVE